MSLLAVPGLLLSLSIIILLGFGTMNVAIAVGVVSVARFARLARSEVMRVRRSEYVEAAFGSGGTFWPVLCRHILPNSLTSVIALAALQFGSAILAISTLGFLGYGAPPPTPEWGLLIAEGRNYLSRAWWLTAAPGFVVVLVVLSADRISKAHPEDRAMTSPLLEIEDLAIAYKTGDHAAARRPRRVLQRRARRGRGPGGRIRLGQDHDGAGRDRAAGRERPDRARRHPAERHRHRRTGRRSGSTPSAAPWSA